MNRSLSLSLSPTTFLPPRPHPHIDHNIYLSCKTLYQATISISIFEISRFPLQFLDILFFSSLETSRSVGRVGPKRIVTKNETRIMHGAIFLLLVLSFSFLSTFLFLLFFFSFFFFLSGGLSGFISFGKSSLLTS